MFLLFRYLNYIAILHIIGLRGGYYDKQIRLDPHIKREYQIKIDKRVDRWLKRPNAAFWEWLMENTKNYEYFWEFFKKDTMESVKNILASSSKNVIEKYNLYDNNAFKKKQGDTIWKHQVSSEIYSLMEFIAIAVWIDEKRNKKKFYYKKDVDEFTHIEFYIPCIIDAKYNPQELILEVCAVKKKNYLSVFHALFNARSAVALKNNRCIKELFEQYFCILKKALDKKEDQSLFYASNDDRQIVFLDALDVPVMPVIKTLKKRKNEDIDQKQNAKKIRICNDFNEKGASTC